MEDQALAARRQMTQGLRPLGSLSSWASLRQRREAMLDSVDSLVGESVAACLAAFRLWLENTPVIVHPISPQHADQVFASYFTGSAPFSQKRSRKDIPDAFIWRSIEDLTLSAREVLLVTGDEGLRVAAVSKETVKPFASLDDLLELPELSSALREGVLDSQLELLQAILESWIHHSEPVSTLLRSSLSGRKVLFFYPKEGDYEVVDVVSIDRVLDDGTPTYYGEGVVVIPFSARATCNLLGPQPSDVGDEHASREERLSVTRVLVFMGSLRVTLPSNLLGEPVPREILFEALDDAEVALESMAIHWELGGKELPSEIFQRHAFDEMRRQIDAGDLDTEIDAAEDADRSERARWRKVPPDLMGSHGDFTLTPSSAFLIAPLPRFEHWVRQLKSVYLEEQKKGRSSTNDEPPDSTS